MNAEIGVEERVKAKLTRPGYTPKEETLLFRELFGNENPVEIDIGCGKGKFLVGRAQVSPAINFIGIDRAIKWMNIGKGRAEKRKLDNLRFFKTECLEFLLRLPEKSVSVFHVYFPDPWPKRRHLNRRLVTAEFLELLWTRLTPGGFLELATDHADYFSAMKQSIAQVADLWKNRRESVSHRIVHEAFKTNYELKFEKAGLPLYYLELQK